MATAEIDQHANADDHHDHPSFLAHHFDTPEQQYDSGKLGMWVFLVTEILFFSGLFCAYAMYRALRPEVYEFCSQFLNTELGAINTGVLLFSSLTMAWAVRAAQLNQHKLTVGMLAATIGCAAIFVGVKAVEYSHKWDLGLLPAGYYDYDPAYLKHHDQIKTIAPEYFDLQDRLSAAVLDGKSDPESIEASALIEPMEKIKSELEHCELTKNVEQIDVALLELRTADKASAAGRSEAAAIALEKASQAFDGASGGLSSPPYLVYLSTVPAIVLAGLIGLLVYSLVTANAFMRKVSMPLVVAAACYFVGVGLGVFLESQAHGPDHTLSEPHVPGIGQTHDDDAHADAAHADNEHDAHADAQEHASGADDDDQTDEVLALLAKDSKNSGVQAELQAKARQQAMAQGAFVESYDGSDPFFDEPIQDVNSAGLAGVFFSIYYCMTGLHAIHIVIGIGVLVWLLVRAVRKDFSSQYFGPVDYVGLYWHIVDLIWIYLFPLLYLIR